MKKIIFPLAFVFLSIFNFSCDKSFFKVQAKKEPILLRVWEGSRGGNEFLQFAASSYSSIHGGVDFIVEAVEPSDVIYQLEADLPFGEAADVFCVTSDLIPYLVENDLICEIKNVSLDENLFMEQCISDSTYKNKIYGMPVALETALLFYNRDLIHDDDVPVTWGDMMNKVRKFNIKNMGKRGLVFDVDDAFVSMNLCSNGTKGIFVEDDSGLISVNDDAFVKSGLELFQKLHLYFDVESDEANGVFARDMFRSGRAAMILSSSSEVRFFEDGPVNFGAKLLPSFTGETNKPLATFYRSLVMCVSSSTKNYESSCSFAKYLTGVGMQQKRFSLTGAFPSVQLQEKSDSFSAVKKQLETSQKIPSNPNMKNIWEEMNLCAKKIWDGEDVGKCLKVAAGNVLKTQGIKAGSEDSDNIFENNETSDENSSDE